MNCPAYSRFDFARDGRANRRDHDAEPRVLLLASAIEPDTGEFSGVIVHFAGDGFTREVPRHSINRDLIAGIAPEQAFQLGRLVEGGELEGGAEYAHP